MFRTILQFELKYWFKNPSFYVYLSMFFFMALASMAGAAGAFGAGSTDAVSIANTPVGVYSFIIFFNKLLIFLLPTIVGTSIYREYKSNFHSILYSYPFGKSAYLAAKFLSGFLVVAFIAFIVEAGLICGALLPADNPAQLLPFDAAPYLQSYFIYLIPNLLLFGAIVFGVVTFTRNIYAGFISVILLLLIKEAVIRLTGGVYGNITGFLLEPFGETATQYFTRHWTLAEQNTLPIPMNPIILYNRLLWLSVTAIIFSVVHHWFSFDQNAVSLGRAVPKPGKVNLRNSGSIAEINVPKIRAEFSFIQQIKTSWRLSRADFLSIVTSGSFISILIAGALFIAVLLLQMNPQTDTKILPLTWVMLGYPVFFFSLLIQVLTFLYAGILVHRAKAAGMADLINVTPVSNWALLLSKWLALVKMQVVLLSLIMVTGIGVQAYSNYFNLEIGHYLFDLFGIHLIGFAIWAFAALLIQTLVTNPYLGLFLLILGALGLSNLPSIGIENLVFRFNENPRPDFFLQYSDLNRYGQALPAYYLYKAYWGLFALLLYCLALLFWQRTLTQTIPERIAITKQRFKGNLAFTTIVSSCLFSAFGFYLFQEENKPANIQFSAREEKTLLRQFQQQYGQYRHTKQPRITAVFVQMDIYPETNSFIATGTYTLVNKTTRSIDTLLIKSGYDEITHLSFDEAVTQIKSDPVFNFSIYTLDKSIAPQDSITLHFTIKNKPNTLFTQHSNVLQNGTFIKSDVLPRLGYFAETEKSLPGDTAAMYNHYQSIDADLIDFETIVSTSSKQTAIAPGYLQKEWTEQNRRYFHYKMDKKIKFVFGFNSGEYVVFKAQHKGVDLRIYHHKQHTYCLQQMMNGLKAALDYNTAHFGEYQHRQAQIIEFPRSEGAYATTAANCIPTSEIRFINDAGTIQDGAIDISFYVAAHELSHQWWGNQVIPADVLGATMITESVAEYITAKVYEQQYGKKSALKFLDIQRNRYLSGRSAETQKEPPLIHVHPDQSYISYGKGAIALYTLSEYIGQENVNRALRAYLEKVKYQTPPYTSSLEMLDFLKTATPDSLQYLIRDMFEEADAQKTLALFDRLNH